MVARPATSADLPAIVALQTRWERARLGAVEASPDEIGEGFDRVDLGRDSLLVFDGAALVGVGLRWRSDTSLLVDPDTDPGPVCAQLLPWFAAGAPAHVEVHSGDAAVRAVLAESGWTHRKSAFELSREVSPELVLAEPSWPDGIAVRGFRSDDAPAVHHLIYVDAGWADVPGHPYRDFDEWHSIFVTEHTLADQQVLAWRGDRLVGVAMGRIWDDGTGWISQLATARDERGRGLGRAMLLEALRRNRDAGARALGLSVQASNRGALQLYLDVGLRIEREWMEYVPG